VPVVASTPTTRERVLDAAGLTAGSTAIMGTLNSRRSDSTATLVAVLHATTIAFDLCSSRKLVIADARPVINAADRSPYGAHPESATYNRCSAGSS